MSMLETDEASEAIAAGVDVSINDSEPLSVASRFSKRWMRGKKFLETTLARLTYASVPSDLHPEGMKTHDHLIMLDILGTNSVH